MIEKTLRILICILAGIAGLLAADRIILLLPPGILPELLQVGIFGVTVGTVIFFLIGGLVGALVGYVIAPWLIGFIWRYSVWMEAKLLKMPLNDVLAGLLGLGIGLIMLIYWAQLLCRFPWSVAISRFSSALCSDIQGSM